MQSSNQSNNYAAILVGSMDIRLPTIRNHSIPTQYSDLRYSGLSPMQHTFDLFSKFIPIENIFLITPKEYAATVKGQLRNLKSENMVLEPQIRNSSASLAYISFKLKKINPKAKLITSPCSKLIKGFGSLKKNCLRAFNMVEQSSSMITLGIKAKISSANRGYSLKPTNKFADDVYKMNSVKKNFQQGKLKYSVSESDSFWSSGILIGMVSDLIDAFWIYEFPTFSLFRDVLELINTPHEEVAIQYVYENCRSYSINQVLFGKANNIYFLELNS